MTLSTRLSALALVALATACGSTVPVSTTARGASGDGLGSGLSAGPLTTEDPTAGANPGAAGPSVPTAAQQGGTGGGATDAPSTGPSAVDGPASAAPRVAAAGGGQGWTGTTAYLGVTTQNDLHALASSAGVSLDPGSFKDDVDSFVATLNATGGLLGRKVVPLYFDVKSSDDGQQAAQAACSYFTQDHKVIAVLSGLGAIDTDNYRACLKKAKTPLFSLSVEIYDHQKLQDGGPYLFLNGAPNLDSFVPLWIDRLQAQGYFAGWNTALGAAGNGAPKVGLLEPNTPYGQKINSLIKAQLSSRGIKVVSEFSYTDAIASYATDAAAAELKFASAGVTHVLTIPPASAILFFFMQSAEQQHYRPAYGFSSYDLPLFFQQNAPAAQLVGGKGVGWFPGEDVDTQHSPVASAAVKGCVAELQKHGVAYPGDAHRVALGAALALCDAVHLLAAGVRSAGAFGAPALVQGLAGVGTSLPLASDFGGHLSATHRARVSAVRDLSFSSSCRCFTYSGPVRAF